MVLKDDPNDPMPNNPEDVDMDSDTSEKCIEDLLFLLSPHISRLPAQYVLQYLITRHKVHVNSAESLIFAIIPYYDKIIFHRVVEAVPIRFGKARAEEEFPRWMENFKTACHPATKGQLISKCPYEKSVSSKLPTKLFLDFCPEFFFTFLEASCRLPYL